MPFLNFLSAALASIFFLPQVLTHGVSRMAMYEDYAKYQDIVEAFEISNFYWLYASNFDIPGIGTKTCINIQISDLSQTGMIYSSGYMEGNSSHSTEYSGIFYTSWPIIKDGEQLPREKFNAIFTKKTDGGESYLGTNFSLIFSDYKNCLIFLALKNEMGSPYHTKELIEDHEKDCIVLLTDSRARKGMDGSHSKYDACQSVYHNACHKYHQNHKPLFQDTCKVPEEKHLSGC